LAGATVGGGVSIIVAMLSLLDMETTSLGANR
jgi:hypothetical protein